MKDITPKEALCMLEHNQRLSDRERREIGELILRMETVVGYAAQVSLDMCEGCDLSPSECAGEMFKNITCPNKVLIESIKAVKP